jgi:FkbM family methyltransferase
MSDRKKVYLEIGAADGVQQVNISKNMDRDNLVILIEANPINYSNCKKNRPDAVVFNNVCCESDAPDSVLFDRGPYPLGGGIADMGKDLRSKEDLIEVPATTIQKICDGLGVATIDKMYLDVEGAEARVLRGISSVIIKYLDVEIHPDGVNWTQDDGDVGHDTEEEVLKECERLGLTEIRREPERNSKIIFEHLEEG